MSIGNFLKNLLPGSDDAHDFPPPKDSPDDFLNGLAEALPDFLQWKADAHIGGVVAVLDMDAAEQVTALLTQQLGASWDRKSVGQAAPIVRHAIKAYGGLRDKQSVYATGLTSDVMLLGLWWPWGHGGSVSIRLVPYGKEKSAAAVEATVAALGKVFDIK